MEEDRKTQQERGDRGDDQQKADGLERCIEPRCEPENPERSDRAYTKQCGVRTSFQVEHGVVLQ